MKKQRHPNLAKITMDDLTETMAELIMESAIDDFIAALGKEECDRIAADGRRLVEKAIKEAGLWPPGKP